MRREGAGACGGIVDSPIPGTAADREEAARQKHARFADERSDFISYLNLWRYLREQRKERSGNAFRRMCREEF